MQRIDEQSVSLEQAQNMMEAYSSVNLDEVSPEVLVVAFSEIEKTSDGNYKTTIITKEIQTRVPMYIFNRMLINQKQMQRIRNRRLQQKEFSLEPEQDSLAEQQEFEDFIDEEKLAFSIPTDEEFREILLKMDIAFVWQLKEILAVWKLTPGESGMSLKRLYLGLTFEQVEALFMRFFGARLLPKTSKA